MLKTVGASGQLSLGKKLAGRHYELEQRPDGSIVLAPVTVTRASSGKAGAAKAAKRGHPRFHVFKVGKFVMPTRDEIRRRGPVR